MDYMDITEENRILIDRSAKELIELSMLAEAERVNRLEEGGDPSNFSFKTNFLLKAINNII